MSSLVLSCSLRRYARRFISRRGEKIPDPDLFDPSSRMILRFKTSIGPSQLASSESVTSVGSSASFWMSLIGISRSARAKLPTSTLPSSLSTLGYNMTTAPYQLVPSVAQPLSSTPTRPTATTRAPPLHLLHAPLAIQKKRASSPSSIHQNTATFITCDRVRTVNHNGLRTRNSSRH